MIGNPSAKDLGNIAIKKNVRSSTDPEDAYSADCDEQLHPSHIKIQAQFKSKPDLIINTTIPAPGSHGQHTADEAQLDVCIIEVGIFLLQHNF